jgi:hypothetical protein
MAPAMLLERRNHPRYPATAECRIRRTNAIPVETVTGDLVEVAPQGARLILATPLIAGERLEIELVDASCGPILVAAEAQWIDRTPEGAWLVGCGLRCELTRAQLTELRGLLSAS